MEAALIGHLLGHAAIIAAVSDRVYWSVRPQDVKTLPAIVLHLVGDGARTYNMDGPSGLVSRRVQVDCWAETFLSAVTVRDAVIAALSGEKILATGSEIQGCFAAGEFASFEAEEGKEAPRRYHRVSLDFLIWHSE